MRRDWAGFALVGCLLGTSVTALEATLPEAFAAATVGPGPEVTRFAYTLDGCVLRQTITNIGYFDKTGEGAGDRVVTTVIDLGEVESLRVSALRGRTLFTFALEFGGPGRLFFLRDAFGLSRSDADRQFDRYSEERKVALARSDLASHRRFSRADGGEAREPAAATLSLSTDADPEGWQRLIALTKECRGFFNGFAFRDDRRTGRTE